jgi:shikimate kinase
MIVLMGFMGAGKTTVGALLADALGLPFVDLDVVIEQRARRSIREIFDREGEPAFRALEHEVAVETLRGSDAVVALGGGAAEHPGTRRELDDATVVYLVVSHDQAMQRITDDGGRPMLARCDVRALYERRLPIYRQTATHEITTNGRRPEEIVLDILALVRAPR